MGIVHFIDRLMWQTIDGLKTWFSCFRAPDNATLKTIIMWIKTNKVTLLVGSSFSEIAISGRRNLSCACEAKGGCTERFSLYRKQPINPCQTFNPQRLQKDEHLLGTFIRLLRRSDLNRAWWSYGTILNHEKWKERLQSFFRELDRIYAKKPCFYFLRWTVS